MAIKINLMPETEKKGWQIPQGDFRLHSLAFLVFIFSLLFFSGIYIYKAYILPKQLSGLEKQNDDLTQMISTSLDENLTSVGKKAKSAQILLKNHLYWSRFFETLESFTLKNIYYDQFTLKQDSAKNPVVKAEIIGHTDNFAMLSKQVAIFMKSKELSNIKFDGGEMDKDGVIKFKISIEVNQDSIKEKTNK